jgi:hypothetical protein
MSTVLRRWGILTAVLMALMTASMVLPAISNASEAGPRLFTRPDGSRCSGSEYGGICVRIVRTHSLLSHPA